MTNQAWRWMRGTDGLAVAQWASAILSIFVIVIALIVLLTENRRLITEKVDATKQDRKAIEREERQRAAARAHLYAAGQDVLRESHTILSRDDEKIDEAATRIRHF